MDLEDGLSTLEARVRDLASSLGERLREAEQRQEQSTTQAVANKVTQSQSARRAAERELGCGRESTLVFRGREQ